jgi:hypothetical protein
MDLLGNVLLRIEMICRAECSRLRGVDERESWDKKLDESYLC